MKVVKQVGDFGDREPMNARAIRDFIDQVNPTAIVTPVIVDIGTQRDPERIMVGLRAEWTE